MTPQPWAYAFSLKVLWVEVGLVAGAVVLVLLSAGLSRLRIGRREARLKTGRDVLARAVTATPQAVEVVAPFRALPWSVQQELLLEFGGSLTGSGRSRLTALGMTTGIAQRAIRLCASPWWWRRLTGARVLTALDYDCDAMRVLLRDRSAVVRAQALVWAAGRTDAPVIDELVTHLSDPERLCRFTVQDSLLRLGRPAAQALQRFLAHPDQAGLADGLSVARGLAQPELLLPALALARHPAELVRARAAATLAVLGTDEGVAALVDQLGDPSGLVRAAAAKALGDLGAWQSATSLYALLGDTSWPVRRESALALRRMGGIGMLTLRRALNADNPFSADMAKQVLDLPESVYQRVSA